MPRSLDDFVARNPKEPATTCALCSLKSYFDETGTRRKPREEALIAWQSGISSPRIAEWLKEEFGLVRSDRTIRDCLNNHQKGRK